MGKTNPYLSRKIYLFCCRLLSIFIKIGRSLWEEFL